MRILFTTFYDPTHVGTRLLAAYMLQLGHEVHFLQFKAFNDPRVLLKPVVCSNNPDKNKILASLQLAGCFCEISHVELDLYKQAIKKWAPDIVCLSTREQFNPILEIFIPAIRQAVPDAFLVSGGFGPTFRPKVVLEYGSDAVVRGEGEETLRELVEAIAQGKNWKDIANVAWLEKGELYENPLRPMLTDLDQYPFPMYDISKTSYIDNDAYFQGDNRQISPWPAREYAYPVLASRGCPLTCSYCSAGNYRNIYKNQGLPAPKVRSRSNANVILELKEAKTRGEQSVAFLDEFFIRPIPELISFFQQYKEEVDLFFFAYFSAEQLLKSELLLDTVIDAGLVFFSFGVQTGSESFARKVYNRVNHNNIFLDCMDTLVKKGIMGDWHYISQNAFETPDDLEQTLEFARKTPYDPRLTITVNANVVSLTPFKGTPLGDRYPKNYQPSPTRTAYLGQLLRARQMFKNDDEFEVIYSDKNYPETPALLQKKLDQYDQENHFAYLMREAKRLAGQEVYFWGCGDAYNLGKHLFKNLKPVCMLYDLAEGRPQEIDGLPVMHPADILPHNPPLPIVIFSYGSYIIHRKIMRDYPEYTDKVFCCVK